MGRGSMLAACVVALVTEAAAQQGVGLASLVRIGGSSRGIALGRAYTSLAGDDALGAFWNPAAIAYGTSGARFAVSDRLLGEREFGMDGPLSFLTAGGSMPLWQGFVGGAGVMYLGVSGVEEYDERAVFQGEFSHAEALGILSLARRSGPVAVGLAARMVRQEFSGLRAGAASGSGLGFEMGVIARFWRPVRIGVTFRDQIDVDADRAPAIAVVGVSYEEGVYVGVPATAVAAIDLEQVRDRPLRIHAGFGLEQIPAFADARFAVRAGLSNRMLERRLSALLTADLEEDVGQLAGDSDQLTFGFGLSRGRLQLDYTVAFGLMHDPQYLTLAVNH